MDGHACADEFRVFHAAELQAQPVVLLRAVQAGVPIHLALVTRQTQRRAGVVGIGGEDQVEQTIVVRVGERDVGQAGRFTDRLGGLLFAVQFQVRLTRKAVVGDLLEAKLAGFGEQVLPAEHALAMSSQPSLFTSPKEGWRL